MITIKDVFEDYKQLNKVYDANEVESLTLLTISQVTNLTKASVKAFPERELNEEQAQKLTNIVAELITGKPIQYILGVTEFYGLPFKVNTSVLIPRPETEELVEWILAVCSGRLAVGSSQWAVGSGQWADGRSQSAIGNGQFAGSILDIGTGSGCIAISLKKNLPQAQVSAIDISEGALQTAKENADLNDVQVQFIQADILDAATTHHSPLTTHHSPLLTTHQIIVSNPPYVTLDDKKQMHTNVTDFEPHTALFVPEDDPLLFYRAIADFASGNLTVGGYLFFEINESLGKETVELLRDKHFTDIELRQDMSGRDRMIGCRWHVTYP
ncbi:peptide chain release factor N(5)-glutamine methyltransferase [Mucilaginibacter sp. OK283]|uniref:peptide chain release factor N(5)-glutamine methyltransferase n=1 Tax=Mucilaginibacter sp. OK283 TaxID=1881049 RepID=UPI0008CB6997|nr:peptide chain release factor N(5)-glutamine methyltransferase [Mucilaginibacter sp. OK283]SEP41420.1 release factor glutamine methyltransferase [Mucilaginibacter sp. OK283]